MEEVTLRDFVLEEALNGVSIGWAKNDNKSEGLKDYAYDFKKDGVGYSYVLNKKRYTCTPNGIPMSDGGHQLYMVDFVIEETRGTAASRGDAEGNEEIVDISALQPREQFALAAMQVILGKLEDPLHADDFTISLLTEQSFKVAQAMMTKAAKVRAETETPPEEDEAIDIDPTTITSTTDKILYNIQDFFKKQVEETKKHNEDYKKYLEDFKSIKEQLTLIAEDLDTISKKESSTELKTISEKVSTLADTGVNVTNMPSEPIYVSVRNTPDVRVSNTVDVNVKSMPSESTE